MYVGIGISITVSLRFDVSTNTIGCDCIQFCIQKAMGFGIVHTIMPLHKSKIESPIMLRAIVSCLVNWNNSIGTSLSPVMAAMPSLASSSSATSSGLSSTDTGTTPCLPHPQLLVRPPCS